MRRISIVTDALLSLHISVAIPDADRMPGQTLAVRLPTVPTGTVVRSACQDRIASAIRALPVALRRIRMAA
jgi:hypothetical protein